MQIKAGCGDLILKQAFLQSRKTLLFLQAAFSELFVVCRGFFLIGSGRCRLRRAGRGSAGTKQYGAERGGYKWRQLFVVFMHEVILQNGLKCS